MSSILINKTDVYGTIYVIFEYSEDTDELTIKDGLISTGPSIELDDIKSLTNEIKNQIPEDGIQYIINESEIKSKNFFDSLIKSRKIELIYSFIPPDNIDLLYIVTDGAAKILNNSIDKNAILYTITLPIV